jgi:hypothetical protein
MIELIWVVNSVNRFGWIGRKLAADGYSGEEISNK